MSSLAQAFSEPPDAASHATRRYLVGTKREQNGRLYVYQQADDAITANTAVKLDAAASASGLKITPATTEANGFYGVAEVAFTDEYFAWVTTRGLATCAVQTGVAAGDRLVVAATDGVLMKEKGLKRMYLTGQFSAAASSGIIADGATHAFSIFPGIAGTVKRISCNAAVFPGDGTSTIKILKAATNGNTMLSTASVDPATKTSLTGFDFTLTSTAADLALTATQLIYCEFVCGTVTNQPAAVTITVEYEPDLMDHVVAVALEANSSGSDANKKVFIL